MCGMCLCRVCMSSSCSVMCHNYMSTSPTGRVNSSPLHCSRWECGSVWVADGKLQAWSWCKVKGMTMPTKVNVTLMFWDPIPFWRVDSLQYADCAMQVNSLCAWTLFLSPEYSQFTEYFHRIFSYTNFLFSVWNAVCVVWTCSVCCEVPYCEHACVVTLTSSLYGSTTHQEWLSCTGCWLRTVLTTSNPILRMVAPHWCWQLHMDTFQ